MGGFSDRSVLVGCMDNSLSSYSLRGKKEYSFLLASPAIGIQSLSVRKSSLIVANIVVQATGEVCMYQGKQLLDTIPVNENVSGSEVVVARTGKYGREDNVLLLLHANGALSVKIM